ncbi:MAG: porin [Herminiimonas sp.]|nr:porin [Herminiimonas sp.]
MKSVLSTAHSSARGRLCRSAGKIAGGAFALMAMTASPSYAQTSVTVYGLIDAAVAYSNKVAAGAASGNSLTINSGTLQGSRLGFKGVEDLGGGLKSMFVLESGFNVDTGASGQGGVFMGRTATVGLAGSLGQAAVGRQADFAYTNLAMFTSASPFGFSTLVNSVHAMNLDRTEGSRLNNSIRYDTPSTLGGFKGSAIYGLGEQAGNASAGQSGGVAGMYSAGQFTVGASYFEVKAAAAAGVTPTTPSSDTGTACANAIGHAGDTCLKTLTLVTGYQAGPALLFASWSQVKQPLAGATGARTLGGSANDKIDLFDVGVNYRLTNSLRLLVSAVQDHASFVGAASGRVTQYNLGLDYNLSKRTDVYTLLGNQHTSGMTAPGIYSAPGGDNAQTVLLTGIRHTF